MNLNPFAKKQKPPEYPDALVYDVIVIGSGSGMTAVEKSVEAGLRVALVDKGPAGGTCLNVGCIPSKMLIAAADRVMEIREANRFGIDAAITEIDFQRVMQDMRDAVLPDRDGIAENLKNQAVFDYYPDTGRFIGDYTLSAGDRVITANTIFIASGARPGIPAVEGLSRVDYLTNETLLSLDMLPRHLVIIGGGYIGAEYGHFFSAMGAEVTLIQRASRLVPDEEPEISLLLQTELGKRMTVHVDTTASAVEEKSGQMRVIAAHNGTDRPLSFTASHILVAAGRRSNADLLEVQKSGIDLDAHGFIRVDDYLQTSREGIWAFGDANGKHMFTHVANAEAEIACQNALNGKKEKMDYRAAPRAVFTYPPIASVGLSEADARSRKEILVGNALYNDTARGMALREKTGFAKIIVEKKSLKILGCHIIGPYAPMLIQEVVNAMSLGGQMGLTASGMHIHPSMSELIIRTLASLSEPD